MPRKPGPEIVASPVADVVPDAPHVNGRVPGLAPPETADRQPSTETEVSTDTEAPSEAHPPHFRAGETRGGHFRRMAHRTRLHLYAFAAVALLVYAVGLAAANTRNVKVDWVFGSSSVPLLWLVLFAAILGWLLGILITTLFRWRTRAPRPS